MVFECEPKKSYEYFVIDEACRIRLQPCSEDRGRRLLRKVRQSSYPRRQYVERRRCLIAAGIVGCLTKWRWTDSVVLSRSGAETEAVSCFLFEKNSALPLQSHLPLHKDERWWRELKSGVWLASCSLTSQTGGNCSAVCTRITITDEEYWGCGPVASQKPDYCAQSPLWGKADFAAWWSL